MIIDEELKLKRLKTIETGGHRTSIKNKNRDNKILENQKNFAAGRLVNIYTLYYFIFFLPKRRLVLYFGVTIFIHPYLNFSIFHLSTFYIVLPYYLIFANLHTQSLNKLIIIFLF